MERIRLEAFRDILQLHFNLTNALEGETSEIVRGNLEAETRVRILERQLQLTRDLQAEAQDQFTDFFQRDQGQMDALKNAQQEFSQFFNDSQPEDFFGKALEDSATRAAQAIENTLGTAIDGLVNGADDLNESLQNIGSSLLKDVGRILFRAGMGGLGVPGFADGGFVGANRVAVVGERGPELIRTGGSGATVTSHEQSKAQLGMYSPGNSANAAENSQPIKVDYTSTTIAGEEYVTAARIQLASTPP